MKSDTPLVDAQMESPNETTVPIEFARGLEREINRLTHEVNIHRQGDVEIKALIEKFRAV